MPETMSIRIRKHFEKVSALKKRFWLHEVAAPAFFIACLGGLAYVVVSMMSQPAHTTKKVAAKEGAYLMTLSRTPFFRADNKQFAVLGLGQDARSGRQIVWIKSSTTNKVKGYSEGESLTGTAIKVARIDDEKVDFYHLGVRIPVRLAP